MRLQLLRRLSKGVKDWQLIARLNWAGWRR